MTSGEAFLRHEADYPYHNGVVDFEKYRAWLQGPTGASEFCEGKFTIIEVAEFGHVVVTQDTKPNKRLTLNVASWIDNDLAVGDTFNGELYRRTFLNCWSISRIRKFEKAVDFNNEVGDNKEKEVSKCR